MSNTSIAIFSDAKKTLENICISNTNKLIFGHLDINSLWNRFDLLSKQIKGSTDIFMLLETKLDGSFPQSPLLIEGFYSPLRFSRNKTGSGRLLYVWENIPAKVLNHDFLTVESFFVEIILHKKRWHINCSYNPHKNSIKNHTEIAEHQTHLPLNLKTSWFWVTLIHVMIMRLWKTFAVPIVYIVSPNSQHVIKSSRPQVALIWF